MMRILVTAGNTRTPLDRVRCITNIFTGQTGTRIACEAHARGHDVCLLTSHPDQANTFGLTPDQWDVRFFSTFDELQHLMAVTIPRGGFDAIVHCAAVSDYHVGGVFASRRSAADAAQEPEFRGGLAGRSLSEVKAGKVKSSYPELWVRLIPTPKLVDYIRTDWSFTGVLVKFKLEVEVSEAELARRAAAARVQSDADLIVANTLEGRHDWALLMDRQGRVVRCDRGVLATRLLDEIERIHRRNVLTIASADGTDEALTSTAEVLSA